ncbi:MAG: Hsp20/alpha crystallin family protein [Blastocatellia bacterium]|nr:Hsp20/alpha crystallin family protein [Blastocatellia bacterium]
MNIYYDPFRALRDMQRHLDRFSEPSATEETKQNRSWTPAVDIYETSSEIVLLTELPGMNDKEFKLNIENNVLTLSGERKPFEEGKHLKINRQERPSGSFSRSFSLPNNTDVNNVKASYKNGVLEIALPKKTEAQPRQIQVTVK